MACYNCYHCFKIEKLEVELAKTIEESENSDMHVDCLNETVSDLREELRIANEDIRTKDSQIQTLIRSFEMVRELKNSLINANNANNRANSIEIASLREEVGSLSNWQDADRHAWRMMEIFLRERNLYHEFVDWGVDH